MPLISRFIQVHHCDKLREKFVKQGTEKVFWNALKPIIPTEPFGKLKT